MRTQLDALQLLLVGVLLPVSGTRIRNPIFRCLALEWYAELFRRNIVMGAKYRFLCIFF